MGRRWRRATECALSGLRHLGTRLPPAHGRDGGSLAGDRAVHRAARHLGVSTLRAPFERQWLKERNRHEPPAKPSWAITATGVSHCGAGCTLGDIIAEFAVFALAITIAGEALFAEYIADYVLAVTLGLAFQYFAIVPMRGLGFRGGIVAAIKADILSLTAFEVGLFAWMALMAFVFFPDPHLQPDSPVYWFLMQIGMIIGFATAWPANVWLIRHGIKEAM